MMFHVKHSHGVMFWSKIDATMKRLLLFALCALCWGQKTAFPTAWSFAEHRQGDMTRNTFSHLILEFVVWNAQQFAPIRNASTLALVGDESIPGSVSLLLDASSPTNIARKIAILIIDPVDAHAPRSIPQQAVEVYELKKLGSDTQGGVFFEILASWISTASDHCAPDRIGAGSGHAMRGMAFGHHFAVKTSARCGQPAAQRTPINLTFLSAVASARPYSAWLSPAIGDWGTAHNYPVTKAPSNEIFNMGHAL